MNIPENFDRWMFDYKEGNLSGAEKEAFENFVIQNPEFELDADAWSNSFVQNEEFVYPNAAELEKDNKFVAGWYGYAAAAIVLLLIGTSVIYLSNNNAEVDGFATIDHEVSTDIVKHANTALSAHEINNHSTLVEDLHNADNNGTILVSDNLVAENNTNNSFNLNVSNDLNDNNGNDTYNADVNPNNSNENDLSVGPDHSTSNDVHYDNDFSNKNKDYNSLSNDPSYNETSMDQELSKFEDETYNSKYQGNPDGSALNFDMGDLEINYEIPKGNRAKKLWRKIERMFDYPVGLTNLRDPDFLLPNNSVVASNPGFVGGMLRPRTEINYRNQWFGNNQNSQQLTMSFDNYFYQMRGGVGIILNAKDYQYGQFGDYNMSLVYSPKIVLGKNTVLEPAVKLTMGALNANGSKLSPESDLEIERGRIISTPAAQQMQGNQQLWYKDYGLGMVLNTKWFYAGFSADNLNRHFENVYNEEGYATPTSSPLLINAMLGTDYESLNKKFSMSPFVNYQKYGERQEVWGGSGFRLNKFIIGGSAGYNIASNDWGFTGSIGMKFEKFKLAYQYDHTKTTITNESIGSHNLTLRFTGKSKPPRLK